MLHLRTMCPQPTPIPFPRFLVILLVKTHRHLFGKHNVFILKTYRFLRIRQDRLQHSLSIRHPRIPLNRGRLSLQLFLEFVRQCRQWDSSGSLAHAPVCRSTALRDRCSAPQRLRIPLPTLTMRTTLRSTLRRIHPPPPTSLTLPCPTLHYSHGGYCTRAWRKLLQLCSGSGFYMDFLGASRHKTPPPTPLYRPKPPTHRRLQPSLETEHSFAVVLAKWLI